MDTRSSVHLSDMGEQPCLYNLIAFCAHNMFTLVYAHSFLRECAAEMLTYTCSRTANLILYSKRIMLSYLLYLHLGFGFRLFSQSQVCDLPCLWPSIGYGVGSRILHLISVVNIYPERTGSMRGFAIVE